MIQDLAMQPKLALNFRESRLALCLSLSVEIRSMYCHVQFLGRKRRTGRRQQRVGG